MLFYSRIPSGCQIRTFANPGKTQCWPVPLGKKTTHSKQTQLPFTMMATGIGNEPGWNDRKHEETGKTLKIPPGMKKR